MRSSVRVSPFFSRKPGTVYTTDLDSRKGEKLERASQITLQPPRISQVRTLSAGSPSIVPDGETVPQLATLFKDWVVFLLVHQFGVIVAVGPALSHAQGEVLSGISAVKHTTKRLA